MLEEFYYINCLHGLPSTQIQCDCIFFNRDHFLAGPFPQYESVFILPKPYIPLLVEKEFTLTGSISDVLGQERPHKNVYYVAILSWPPTHFFIADSESVEQNIKNYRMQGTQFNTCK